MTPIALEEFSQAVHNSDAVPLHLAMIQLLRRLIPFLVTGVTNSIVGFSVIFLCLAVGTGGIAANEAAVELRPAAAGEADAYALFDLRAEWLRWSAWTLAAGVDVQPGRAFGVDQLLDRRLDRFG